MFHARTANKIRNIDQTALPPEKEAARYALGFVGLLSLLPLLATVLPRFLAYGPGLAGLIFYLVYSFTGQRPAFHARLWIMAAAILGLAFASTLWALDPGESMSRSLKMAGILIPGLLLLETSLSVPRHVLERYLWIFAAGVLAALFLMDIEYAFGYPLYKLVRGMPASEEFPLSQLNRGTVTCMFLLFPVIAILTARYGRRAYILAGVTVLSLPTLLMTESQSAQLAAFTGAATLLFFPYGAKTAWNVLTAFTLAGLLVAPFAAMWLFSHYAPQIHAIPMMGEGGANAGNRLEIWDYISRYALQRPLYGYGIEATRAVEAFDTQEIFQEGATILHPHNFALQIWIEFGLLGIAVFSGILAYVLLAMRNLSPAQQKACLPAFVSVLSVSLTGYGLWQGWWLGLIFLVMTAVLLATRVGFTSNPK